MPDPTITTARELAALAGMPLEHLVSAIVADNALRTVADDAARKAGFPSFEEVLAQGDPVILEELKQMAALKQWQEATRKLMTLGFTLDQIRKEISVRKLTPWSPWNEKRKN